MKNPLISLLLFAVFAPAALASGPQVMPKSYNETFPIQDIRYGAARKSKVECDATINAVWVTASWVESGLFRDSTETTSECIRYFPSDDAIGAKTAIFYFQGDVFLQPYSKIDDYGRHPDYPGNTYTAQVNIANNQSRDNGIPYIHLARPGMYGSTGNTYTHRHSKKEAAIMVAALDAVKAAFGYTRISIVGQSGGGTLVGTMLTSGRSDLDCAVVSSGAVSYKTRMRTSKQQRNATYGVDTTGLSLKDVYDPIDNLNHVAVDPKRRVFMLGDENDEAVSFESQKEFADKANSLGISVNLIAVTGGGREHHDTYTQGVRTVGRCLAGLNNSDIEVKARAGTVAIQFDSRAMAAILAAAQAQAKAE